MCHGTGAQHIKAPSKTNIINPARLTKTEDRLNVCAQRHTRPNKSKKSSLAQDLRGFRIGEKYEDYADYTSPAWGVGNRQVSIDGKGRRDHQQNIDIMLTAYLKPWSIHGKMACFDCHDAHNIGNNPATLTKANTSITGTAFLVSFHKIKQKKESAP